MHGMMGGMMGGGFFGNRMLFFPYGGIVMWWLVIIIIGVVVYLIIRNQKIRGGMGGTSRETPLEILKKRYARGEITKEEYESIKQTLL